MGPNLEQLMDTVYNINADYFLCNEKLENVNFFKYLGIHFFKNGNSNRTQKGIADHAAYALHNLLFLFNQFELPTSGNVNYLTL